VEVAEVQLGNSRGAAGFAKSCSPAGAGSTDAAFGDLKKLAGPKVIDAVYICIDK
jgi:hypothetical protein